MKIIIVLSKYFIFDDPVELKGLSSLLWNDYAFRFIHCNMPKAVFLVPTGNSMHTSTGFPRFPAKKVSFFLEITFSSNRNYKGTSIPLRGYTHAGFKIHSTNTEKQMWSQTSVANFVAKMSISKLLATNNYV